MHERPMIFSTFSEMKDIEKIQDIIKYIAGKPVSQLFNYLERYSKSF
jgi:hypothetical protein